MERINDYFNFLQENRGSKVRLLPVSLPVVCPTLEEEHELLPDGCYFCSGDEFKTAGGEKEQPGSIREQLLAGKNKFKTQEEAGDEENDINRKLYNQTEKCNYIAYFENFPSTFMPLNQLKTYVREAMSVKNIVKVVLATRPDCISYQYLKEIQQLIKTVNTGVDTGLDLALQTVNYHTLSEANCDYGLGEFIDAVLTARTCGFEIGVQVMLDLPGDSLRDVKENARILSALRVDNVKIRKRPIIDKDSEDFLKNRRQIARERIVKFLRYLDPRIPVLILQAGRKMKPDVNLQNRIAKKMIEDDVFQGDRFDYLQGACLDNMKESGCDAI